MKKILIGSVPVDSGQLMVCDPCYIDGMWIKNQGENRADFAHKVYRHVASGKLWQYTYDGKSIVNGVTPFPGSYADIIPEYGKCPNDLRDSGEFVLEPIDYRPHIPDGEVSYRGICKNMSVNEGSAGVEHGVITVFRSGLGDGMYPVYAVIKDGVVVRVVIEFFEQKEK